MYINGDGNVNAAVVMVTSSGGNDDSEIMVAVVVVVIMIVVGILTHGPTVCSKSICSPP